MQVTRVFEVTKDTDAKYFISRVIGVDDILVKPEGFRAKETTDKYLLSKEELEEMLKDAFNGGRRIGKNAVGFKGKIFADAKQYIQSLNL